MKYTSEIDSTTNICKVRIVGEFRRPQDADEMKRFAVSVCAERRCHRFLFDMSQAEIIGGTMGAFVTADVRGELADSLRKLKVAVLHSHINHDEDFFETVAVNRGFPVHAFDDLDKAVEWLTE